MSPPMIYVDLDQEEYVPSYDMTQIRRSMSPPMIYVDLDQEEYVPSYDIR